MDQYHNKKILNIATFIGSITIYKQGVIMMNIKNITYNTACYWQIMHVTGQN